MRKPIVFFDIDGTLLNEDKIIPDSTKKVVRLLQKKGIHIPLPLDSSNDGILNGLIQVGLLDKKYASYIVRLTQDVVKLRILLSQPF